MDELIPNLSMSSDVLHESNVAWYSMSFNFRRLASNPLKKGKVRAIRRSDWPPSVSNRVARNQSRVDSSHSVFPFWLERDATVFTRYRAHTHEAYTHDKREKVLDTT